VRDRLLIVDDDIGVRKQIRWSLTDGFDVDEAASPEEARARFLAHRPDVVTMDLRITGPRCQMGLELLEEFLSHDPDLKVIMVSAETDEVTARRAVEMGAWDYFTKPLSAEDLRVIAGRAARVRRLQRERPVDTQVSRDAEVGPAIDRYLPSAVDLEGWLGRSPVATRVARMIRALAPSRETVLVTGEPGSGADLAARALHSLGQGAGRFVRVRGRNGLPAPESIAPGSTVLLEDLGDLEPGDRARIPEWGESLRPDRRLVVSALTGTGARAERERLPEATREYLSAVTVDIPPLRERPEDIVEVARSLVACIAPAIDARARGLSEGAAARLLAHRWPGNLRELEKRVLAAVLVAESDLVEEGDLWLEAAEPGSGPLRASLAEVERTLVDRALQDAKGNISRAARHLEVSRPTLHALVRKHGIDPATYRGVSGA
jgi:two-component system NtrC family response regulator